MLKQKIAITGFASVSALGEHEPDIWQKYLSTQSHIIAVDFDKQEYLVARFPNDVKEKLARFTLANSKYKNLDSSVIAAMYTAEKAIAQTGWKNTAEIGVNIGSSRGATHLFEKYYEDFLINKTAQTLVSPTTTLGNIATWVAHHIKSESIAISHSITCSTSLQAIANAAAWLQSGMSTQFVVGGSETPLTAFTLAQMRALKIYAQKSTSIYPCQALNFSKNYNSMVLGEGTATACLELGEKENALAYITGIGYATESLEHNTSISTDGICFQKAMRMALKGFNPANVDAIVMHAPGTIKGDLAEYEAVKSVFGNTIPFLTSNKWKIGHTFGASGILSLELALLMIRNNTYIKVPYIQSTIPNRDVKNVLINAVGFGGNAVSILISKH